MTSTHYWRAELLTTLFLIVSVIVLYRRDRRSPAQMFSIESRWIRAAVLLVAAFTLWSLCSALGALGDLDVASYAGLDRIHLSFSDCPRDHCSNSKHRICYQHIPVARGHHRCFVHYRLCNAARFYGT